MVTARFRSALTAAIFAFEIPPIDADVRHPPPNPVSLVPNGGNSSNVKTFRATCRL
jgi:hypothetical protein